MHDQYDSLESGIPVPVEDVGALASTQHRPVIRALSQRECIALLSRNRVGRLAFTFHDQVDIQPLHYVYEAGWIYGRTSEGAKLTTLAHYRWVAFEVDEVRDTFDWASVVVHGSFHRLEPESAPADAATAVRAIHLLRTIVPDTLTAEDPVPFRTVFFRIAVGETTGRIAVLG
jgi:nitroimidazol reductase NimA-like FMN-containing flavoprotein (pyridoxamine 5'-phosphate oxidase superfamily)